MPDLPKSAVGLMLLSAALVLSSCGGSGGSTPADDTAPTVAITSPGVSVSAEYQLTGTAWDDTGIASASYSLNGGEAELTVSAGEFSTPISLQPGLNDITVTVTDAAGNEGSASRSVQFGEGNLTLSRDTAMRGTDIELSGSFGPGGTVTIGGIPASVSNWSASSITAEIPAGAPNGWTEVTVTSNSGLAVAPLFVGTTFAPGSLNDLVTLGLPAGTAVRLEAGTYTVDATPLVINGLSLYGAGPEQTTIDTGTAADALSFGVGQSHDFALHDLALITDGTYIIPAGLEVTAAGSSFDPAAYSDAIELAAALTERTEHQLTSQASRPRASLQNLEISHKLGGSLLSFGVTDVFSQVVFHGDVIMDNVHIDTASIAFVVTSGEVTVTDSSIKAGGTTIMALGGDLRVERSSFDLGDAPIASGLIGHNRFLADRVEFINRGSNPMFGSLAAQAADLPLTHGSSVTNSTFYAFEPDTTAIGPDTSGSIAILLAGSPSYFVDNTITSHRDTTISLGNGNVLIEGNEFNIGASGIAEANLTIGQLNHYIPGHLFRNNQVHWQVNGGVRLSGYYGSLEISDNEFVGAGTGTAVTLVEVTGEPSYTWDVAIAGNHFLDFTNAFSLRQPTTMHANLELLITANIFDFEFTAAPQVAELTDVANATIDASGNQWGSLTTAAEARAFVTEGGTTPPGTFVIDDVLTP